MHVGHMILHIGTNVMPYMDSPSRSSKNLKSHFNDEMGNP